MKAKWTILAALGLGAASLGSYPVQAQTKPNIVIIRGDDIGQSNISAYSRGITGRE